MRTDRPRPNQPRRRMGDQADSSRRNRKQNCSHHRQNGQRWLATGVLRDHLSCVQARRDDDSPEIFHQVLTVAAVSI